MEINILDGFSGIGGFSLAIQRAGFKINNHYASELDKYAQMIYRRNFNGSIQLGDITRVGYELGKIDIITGGFPCQAFSIAGKRRGFEDTRGTLFFEIERLCRFYKPSYMVLENVKGLASHEGGDTIRVILDKLRGLDYSVQLLLLNTKDFGIPQNRERFFFICTARGERQPEISHIREAKRENTFSANCIDANYWKGIDNHGQRTCVKIGTLRTHKDGEGFREMKSGECPTIPARAREDGSGQPMIIQTPRGNNKGGIKTIVPTITKNSYEHNNHLLLSDSGLSRKRELRDIAPPLRAHDGCGHDNYCIVENQRGEIRKMDESPSLQASNSGRIGQSPPVINYENSIIRRLTPVECERLQDYPDNWTKYGIDEAGKEVEISDTQRYKTCGNSITVKPAELIMRAIKDVL